MGTIKLLIFRCPSKTPCHLTHNIRRKFPKFTIKLFAISFKLGFSSGIRELIDAQLYGSFHLCKVKISRRKNFVQFCQVRRQCWQKESSMLKFFVFESRNETTYIASFLFCDRCFSAAQIAKISLLALTAASLDNHLVLNTRCNCRPFVLIVVWCIARQADHNGETMKHFHNCNKGFSQFCTPYCTNLRPYSKRPKRGSAHDNAQIPNLQLQPSVAVAKGRKTCFLQFVLLQYKAKPYLGFQNLGCHRKILVSVWHPKMA